MQLRQRRNTMQRSRRRSSPSPIRMRATSPGTFVPLKCLSIRSWCGRVVPPTSLGSFTISGTATAPMIFSISALIAWPVRSARFIYQKIRRKRSFSKLKRTCCDCVRIFRWPTRNSQLWKMDLPRTNNYSQSWPTYRRQQNRLPDNSAESISCNCRWVNSQPDPAIGRSFATFCCDLRSSDHFSGNATYPALAPSREPSLWTKEMAATKCGHLDSALCGSLNFYRRHVTRHALPLAVRHLYPGVSPTHVFIDRLSRLIGALSFGGTRSDGRIPKYSYFHIFVFHAVIFGGFRVCQQLGPVSEFSIGSRTNKLVGQQRGDQVRIICFL